jgi:hypothetical protein
LIGLVGAMLYLSAMPPSEAPAVAGAQYREWIEVKWPFPIDEWGTGKAFRCGVSACGEEINIYVRPKIGFCNCTTGVADDDELDRLSDFNLVGGELSPLGEGQQILIGRMNGRSRPFAINGRNRVARTAISVAFNDRCDAMVALALLPHDRPAVAGPHVIKFLNSKTILQWASITLGQ